MLYIYPTDMRVAPIAHPTLMNKNIKDYCITIVLTIKKGSFGDISIADIPEA